MQGLLALIVLISSAASPQGNADASDAGRHYSQTAVGRSTAALAPESAPPAPVMIILDASGSMTTADTPGPRIDAAKQAITALIDALPDGSPVGLLVYGTGTSSSDADKAAGCQDVKLLIPVGPVDKPAFIEAVQGVSASGYTPMGGALEMAANALPRSGPASIVLVSDGIDTCAPPSTCEVASTLKANDGDLVIHTVGFKEDDAARAELSCVADAGGGTYRSAADGPGLTAVLQGQVDAALRPYVVAGIPITGTSTAANAPEIEVGQYWDTLAAGGPATNYYSIKLSQNETVNVANTVVPGALRGGGAEAKLAVVTQLQDRQGNLCLPTQRENDTLLAGKVDPVTALISAVVGGPDWSKRCPDDGEFLVAVTRDSTSTVPTRVETIVQVEQPVSGTEPSVTAPTAGLQPPPLGPALEVSGGASFNTAPVIPTGTYHDSLSTGETRYYKVHLDWGQQVSYQVVVDKISGLDHGSGYARTAIATPLRRELPLSSNSNAARKFGGPESVSMTGSTLVPVNYGNRGSDRSDIRLYSVAGDYFLSVGMSYPVDAVPYRTDISLAIQVVGQAAPGPQYEPARQSEATQRSGQVPVSSQSAIPQPSETSGPVTDALDPEKSATGYPMWIWLIAIATAIAVSIGMFVWVRRRSTRIG